MYQTILISQCSTIRHNYMLCYISIIHTTPHSIHSVIQSEKCSVYLLCPEQPKLYCLFIRLTLLWHGWKDAVSCVVNSSDHYDIYIFVFIICCPHKENRGKLRGNWWDNALPVNVNTSRGRSGFGIPSCFHVLLLLDRLEKGKNYSTCWV